MRVTPYRVAVGALMWASTMTRPDVAYAAHYLGKINDNPGPVHWRAAKRALHYLWRTKDVGITYGGTQGSCTKLSACVDDDFTTCPDTRRSVLGGAVMLGGGAISWFSRVQKGTAAASFVFRYDSITESYAWELLSVFMCYPQGDGFSTSLSRLLSDSDPL